jgi:guanylate kinase
MDFLKNTERKAQKSQGPFKKISIQTLSLALPPATMTARTGILLIVSGPSGSGKTTLCRRLAEAGEVHYSISCTTRPPRPGERDGTDYHFLTPVDFAQRLAAGDFLEHATVHGNLYGSLKSEVLSHLQAGTDVVMDIDVQGAEQVRHCQDPEIRSAFTDLFVMPPSEEELHQRLTGRGTDLAEVISLRMANALEEMTQWRRYRYCLVSASREEDYAKFQALVTGERLRVSRIS